jgi:transcriptional regulator with XRE-family HTH domain
VSSKNIFPSRLKNLRVSKGLSLAQLATIVGLNKTSVYAFEEGRTKPAFDTLLALTDALGCSVDYLMGVSNSKEPPKWLADLMPDMATLDHHGQEAVKALIKGLKK